MAQEEESNKMLPGEQAKSQDQDAGSDKIQMKKELGLIEGVAIILGIIIGSGIFISPKGVIAETGSVGMSLVVWTLCGFLAMIGALCYAELGTAIPKSGSDYAYIGEAFGPLPSFLYLWAANLVFVPTTNAIMALTVANYMIQPLFPECEPPGTALALIAALCICFLTWLNCYSMKVTTSLQNTFMFTKLAALGIVVLVGLVVLFQGGYERFYDPWKNTSSNPSQIAVAFYSGIYSYAGWNYLNFMTEELKDPYKNLPRAIYISLPLVTFTYVLANIAYLAVLNPVTLVSSNAVAVTFANRALGFGSVVVPILVAISAFGGLSCHIMTSSRLCFVGARQGHFPDALSLITLNNYTPKPALIFLGALSLLYLGLGDIYQLIEYATFVETFFILMSICSLLYLRWKKPDMDRPIKVRLGIPILFLLICTFLVFMPIFERPFEVGMGILITASGIPVYFLCVYWKNKPDWFKSISAKLTNHSQKLFMGVKEQ